MAGKVAEADRSASCSTTPERVNTTYWNLVESYQRNSMEADERLRVVRRLLEENGASASATTTRRTMTTTAIGASRVASETVGK